MADSYRPADFKLQRAEQKDAELIRAHYDAVIKTNNALLAANGTPRYIDWIYPFPLERVEAAIEQERLLVVRPETRHTTPAALGEASVYATFITDAQPDPEIWHDIELPANALGFGKFAAKAALLGHGFGCTVAIPLLVAHARESGHPMLFCDALPHLDNYYTSLGFEGRGSSGFYSKHYQQFVTVNRYTFNLDD